MIFWNIAIETLFTMTSLIGFLVVVLFFVILLMALLFIVDKYVANRIVKYPLISIGYFVIIWIFLSCLSYYTTVYIRL